MWMIPVTAFALLAASACSSGGDAADSGVASTAAAAPADDDGPLFTEGAGDGLVEFDDEGQPVEPVVESLPPVPETGVPGIDSGDDFCRAWSTYAGSVQAISLAWALQPRLDAARLEVAANDAMSAAVLAMIDTLPDELADNAMALTVDVPTPFLARAERARILLADAGLDEGQITALGDAWIVAISEQGIDSDTLAIAVPAETAAALDVAATQFADELPSVIEDPTLDTTAFDISPSLAYISDNCPDQGTLAGNDVIDAGGA